MQTLPIIELACGFQQKFFHPPSLVRVQGSSFEDCFSILSKIEHLSQIREIQINVLRDVQLKVDQEYHGVRELSRLLVFECKNIQFLRLILRQTLEQHTNFGFLMQSMNAMSKIERVEIFSEGDINMNLVEHWTQQTSKRIALKVIKVIEKAKVTLRNANDPIQIQALNQMQQTDQTRLNATFLKQQLISQCSKIAEWKCKSLRSFSLDPNKLDSDTQLGLRSLSYIKNIRFILLKQLILNYCCIQSLQALAYFWAPLLQNLTLCDNSIVLLSSFTKIYSKNVRILVLSNNKVCEFLRVHELDLKSIERCELLHYSTGQNYFQSVREFIKLQITQQKRHIITKSRSMISQKKVFSQLQNRLQKQAVQQ